MREIINVFQKIEWGEPLHKEVRNNQNHDYPVAAINILATASQRLYNLPHLALTSGKDVREGGQRSG